MAQNGAQLVSLVKLLSYQHKTAHNKVCASTIESHYIRDKAETSTADISHPKTIDSDKNHMSE